MGEAERVMGEAERVMGEAERVMGEADKNVVEMNLAVDRGWLVAFLGIGRVAEAVVDNLGEKDEFGWYLMKGDVQ
jgi:hypothetical protein